MRQMPKSDVFCQDCLEAMRSMPDNTYDLAVVDPPYGAGFTEGGGCQGWFAKYHQNDSAEREREGDGGPQYNRFGSPGSRFEKYKRPLKEQAETEEDGKTPSTGKKS